jgi:hypothetical protein
MAIAVSGVLSALSSTMRNAARLTDYDRSAMLARRKMDELLIDRKLPKFVFLEGQWDPAMVNGRQAGWRARIQPWEMPPGSGPGSNVLERVELEVWWLEGDRRRGIALEGFRRGILTPADVAQGAIVPK